MEKTAEIISASTLSTKMWLLLLQKNTESKSYSDADEVTTIAAMKTRTTLTNSIVLATDIKVLLTRGKCRMLKILLKSTKIVKMKMYATITRYFWLYEFVLSFRCVVIFTNKSTFMINR